MKSITVEKLLGNNKNYQQVTGNEESLKRVILTGEINRPGFELAGFFKHSDFRRIIVFGDKEMAFIAEMTEERQKEIFPCLINEEVPCILICKGHACPEVLKNIADERNFPIFQTEMITGVVSSELMNTLEEKLARETLMHGVFLNIHGKGVIIKGDSGIGKSEIALELVKRGHLLVADDAVELYRIGQKIVGKAPAVLANLLEIRGIGVIDVSWNEGGAFALDTADQNEITAVYKALKNVVVGEELGPDDSDATSAGNASNTDGGCNVFFTLSDGSTCDFTFESSEVYYINGDRYAVSGTEDLWSVIEELGK